MPNVMNFVHVIVRGPGSIEVEDRVFLSNNDHVLTEAEVREDFEGRGFQVLEVDVS